MPETRRHLHLDSRGESGRALLLDQGGRAVAEGTFGSAGRELAVPPVIGTTVVLQDRAGTECGRAMLTDTPGVVMAVANPRAVLSIRVKDDRGSSIPSHLLFHGLDATPDPSLAGSGEARAGIFDAGRSLYVVHGVAAVTLPPGRYRLTATHGTRYSLFVQDITVRAGEHRSLDVLLHDIDSSSAWTSGDFHLHAAPSMDSEIALDARVATLVAEGLDFAVATDHNRVTDYGPSIVRLGVSRQLVTTPGDELTSYGSRSWGHFNVYPLPPAAQGAEESAPPYFDLGPAQIFAAARKGAAEVHASEPPIIQVNHARLGMNLGYFDIVRLDARTGAADPSFSGDFDVLEAYNGSFVTKPAKVREGAIDLVALARRGIHVAATGNSDSHHLLYQEAGYARTFVHVAREPIETRKERVFAALRAHDTTVSSGPLVEMTVDGSPIGSVVRPSTQHEVRVHVRVTAPAWVPVEHVEIWHDDLVAFQVDVVAPPSDGVRYEDGRGPPLPGRWHAAHLGLRGHAATGRSSLRQRPSHRFHRARVRRRGRRRQSRPALGNLARVGCRHGRGARSNSHSAPRIDK